MILALVALAIMNDMRDECDSDNDKYDDAMDEIQNGNDATMVGYKWVMGDNDGL